MKKRKVAVVVNQELNVPMVNKVVSYIGLGSNLNEPREQLITAIAAIKKLPASSFLSCSSFYRSKAVTLTDDVDAPDYLNAVVAIETQLDPLGLLDELQAIEFSQGRRRNGERWAARTLDLDILLYADDAIENERLIIPHQQMCLRDFVLLPLAEIAPEIVIAGKGHISSYFEGCQKNVLEKIPCELSDT